MSSLHQIKLEWRNDSNSFEYETYSRSHSITFEGGISINASSAVEFRGNSSEVNPEEQLVAAVSSCHMLTFLAIAARKRMFVKHYSDHAIGTLAINKNNRMAITKVVLNPVILFEGTTPDDSMMKDLHHRSHIECFIANSVNFEIEIIAHGLNRGL